MESGLIVFCVIVFSALALFCIDLKKRLSDCKDMIDRKTMYIDSMMDRIMKLENPPKYKVGDFVIKKHIIITKIEWDINIYRGKYWRYTIYDSKLKKVDSFF